MEKDNSITFVDYMLRDEDIIRSKQIPLGILCLASNINDRDCYLADIDRRIQEQDNYAGVVEKLLSYKSKYYGFSSICTSYHISLEIAKKLKENDSETVIIFGGPHATATAFSSINNFDFIDFIIMNEADFSLPLLLEKNDRNEPPDNIKGICYKLPDDKVIFNNGEFIKDLDSLPVPKFESIKNIEEINSKYNSVISIDIGRGCPFNCSYCSTAGFFQRKYRIKSTERILTELEYYNKNYNIDTFSFTHDMLTYDKKLINSLSEKIKKMDSKTWSCSVRFDCIDDELMKNMTASGCNGIFCGMETGSKRMQKIIGKNLSLDNISAKIELFHKYKIDAHIAYIVGFPEEKKEDIYDTLASALEATTCFTSVQSSILSPVADTKVYFENQDKLSFDGYFGSYSKTILTEPEINNYIKKYKDIFSSFYYVHNKNVSRELIILADELITNMPCFKFSVFVIISTLGIEFIKSKIPVILEFLISQIRKSKNRKYDNFGFNLYKYVLSFIKKNKNLAYLKDIISFELSFQTTIKSLMMLNILNKLSDNKNYSTINSIKNLKIYINNNIAYISADYNIKEIFDFIITNRDLPYKIKKNNTFFIIEVVEDKSFILWETDLKIYSLFELLKAHTDLTGIYNLFCELYPDTAYDIFIKTINSLLKNKFVYTITE